MSEDNEGMQAIQCVYVCLIRGGESEFTKRVCVCVCVFMCLSKERDTRMRGTHTPIQMCVPPFMQRATTDFLAGPHSVREVERETALKKRGQSEGARMEREEYSPASMTRCVPVQPVEVGEAESSPRCQGWGRGTKKWMTACHKAEHRPTRMDGVNATTPELFHATHRAAYAAAACLPFQ